MRALAFDELPPDDPAFEQAAEAWAEALAAAGGSGDDRLRAAAGCNLGWAALRLGRIGEAEARFRAALPLFRVFGDAAGELAALDGCARAALLDGRHAEAEALCERAIAVAPSGERARLLRVELWERLGRWSAAVAEARAIGTPRAEAAATRASARLDGAIGEAQAPLVPGIAHLAEGRADEALATFDAARIAHLAGAWPVEAALASVLSACALADAGRPRAAEGLLAEAELELDGADPAGVGPPFELARAHLALANGDPSTAAALVAATRARGAPCAVVGLQLAMLEARTR